LKYSFLFLIFIQIIIGIELNAQKLNPGDGVRLIFLDVTDAVAGDYFIQPDGKIQFPFIGIINTTGKEFPQLKNEVHLKYDSLYRNPELTILALIKVNIMGEVFRPGYYYVTEDQRLNSILALAGGITGNADLDGIYILQGQNKIELDVETIMEEENTAIDFGLQSGDQIYVPRSFWADPERWTWIFTAILAVVSVVVLISN
jgi:polysaccharide biosynthesis/export protein